MRAVGKLTAWFVSKTISAAVSAYGPVYLTGRV